MLSVILILFKMCITYALYMCVCVCVHEYLLYFSIYSCCHKKSYLNEELISETSMLAENYLGIVSNNYL